MTHNYPKYIVEEVCRRIAVEFEKMTGLDKSNIPLFDPGVSAHAALAQLLIEQGFKPPVDPLISRVAELGYAACMYSKEWGQGEDFLRRLEDEGITITVRKKDD